MKNQDKHRTYQWYIEPLGDHTNEQVGNLVAELQLPGDNFYPHLTDGQGREHRLIDVGSYALAKHIVASRQPAYLRFEVFFKPQHRQHVARWTLHINKSTKTTTPHQEDVCSNTARKRKASLSASRSLAS